MSLTFTFALSQSQTFELRCDYGNRRLDTKALAELIELCEAKYYSQQMDDTAQLISIGRELYSWLDGKEGWLRRAAEETDEQVIYLDLIQTSEAQGLNPQTQKVALGLAHLPWELLHDGTVFLRDLLPVRSVQQRTNHTLGVQNRPLRLLFMATSPEYPGIAPLQFEQEEGNILQATSRQPLGLVVEESGSVSELGNLVQSYPEDHFDVFHLTGHGVIYTEKNFGKLLPKGKKIKDYTPCFITEDEVGNVVFTTVADLSKAFKRRFPRVIFLSGCHTGQLANQGTVPSMAEALVKAGAGVVLGWARPVFDRTGIIAAQALYQALATGATVEDGVKAAQQEMIEQECSDWHLLRIYRDTRPIQELVTPLGTRKREKLRFTPPEREFLDENNLVKVASRREFVGRRKALQRCLRALQQTSDNVGVFIAGMGGLGKSSLAARLCTRVQSQRENFHRVVLVGVVDEAGLLNKLSNKYQRFAGVPGLLNQPGISLQGRLENFLAEIEDTHDAPLLLVLDDFEQNIPQANITDGSLRLSRAAYGVLEALCGALAENQGESRLIVTCRYLQEDTLPAHSLHLESLAGMGKGDINKIVRDLEQGVREKVREKRIIKIADGNPRLLKWLLDVVQQPEIAEEELLKQLEQTQQEFRENILARMLVDGLEDGEREFLARLSVFRLPVREENLTLPCQASLSLLMRGKDLSQGKSEGGVIQEILGKLASLSLVESATVYATQQREYRVMRILEPFLKPVLTKEEWQTTRKVATQSIYKSWWEESDNRNEEQAREIVRLAVLAEEKEIAVTVGDVMASNWVNGNRYVEAWELCRDILQLGEDYRILGTVARAESILGLVGDALTHYQTALQLCPEDDDLTTRASIIHNMAGLKAQQGEIEDAITLYNQSLEITDSINNIHGKAATLNAMGYLKAQQGEIEQALALYNQSLEIEESINDVKGKATTLHQMADLKAQQGEIENALALYNQSLEIYESINNIHGKAITLHSIAMLKAQQGEIEQALALYNQSLKIEESINDVKGKAATLHSIAILKAQQGEIEQALALYNQSLEIEDSINNVKGKATTLHNMADLKVQQGEIEEAIALYNQSLQIFESIDNITLKAATLHQMAGLKAQQGEIEDAIALYNQSLQIAESIGDMKTKATTLNNMAGLKAQRGDIEGAIVLYNQSLQITESIGDVKTKATTLNNMAYLKAQKGEIEGAIVLYNQSLQITESIGDVKTKATTLNNMALLKAQRGDIEGAIVLYNQSLQITESIGDVKTKATTLNNMAYLKAQKGEIEGAIVLYNQSLQITESIGDVKTKATTLNNMALLKAEQGDIEGAIALYDQSLQIAESINDVRTKASTLNNMAHLKAEQGDIEGVIALYNQSLQITESINDVQGKAIILMNIAYYEGKRTNKTKELELNLQVTDILGKIRDYINLRVVLTNLGVTDESKGIIYFAQAVWLCLQVQIPVRDLVNTLQAMYNRVPKGDEMKALLGATAYHLCQMRGAEHPQLEELQERSFDMLVGAARAQGIETEEDFDTWYVQQRLNEPEYFIPRLVEKLGEIVGDEWLFTVDI